MIEQLKHMTASHFWLSSRRMSSQAGAKLNLRKPPAAIDRWWGETSRNQELFRLKRALQSRRIQAQEARRKIWKDLCLPC
jgi:hypothetical protein